MVTRTGTTYNSELRIWSGPDRTYDSNVALGTYIFDYLKSEVNKHPEKVIQVGKGIEVYLIPIPINVHLSC